MSAQMLLERHGVTRLCHFTKIQGFTHILSSADGIVASSSIRPDVKNQIDPQRYDGELEHVCCSVQYPNSWYLRKAKERDANQIFKDWIAIFISLDILNHRTAKFCECNAAKSYGRYIFSDPTRIDSLYASPTELGWKRDNKMLACCPTNDQAEILIKDNIPYSFFTGIAVSCDDDARRIYAMIKTYEKPEIPIYLAPDILSTRWSQLVRAGIKPNEADMSFREDE